MSSGLLWFLSVSLILCIQFTFIPNINAEDTTLSPTISPSQTEANETEDGSEEVDTATDINVDGNNTFNETDFEDEGNGTNATDYSDENVTTVSPELPTTPAPNPEDAKLIVDDFCLCDLKVGYCDVNCCCDEDCDVEDRQVFSHCEKRPQNVLDHRYCFQQHIIFSNNTEYKVDYIHDGLFCIVTDNLIERTTYTAVKGATSLKEFEDLPKEKPHYSFVQSEQVLMFKEDPYIDGSPLWGVSHEGYVFNFAIPDSIVGNECEAETGVRFLQEFESSCYRVFQYLPDDCQTNMKLNALQYLSFYVVADPSNLYQKVVNATESSTPVPTTTEIIPEETTTSIPTTSEITEPPPTSEIDTTNPPELDPNEQLSTSLLESSSIDGLITLEGNTTDQLQLLTFNVSLCHWEKQKEICVNISINDIPQPVYMNDMCHNVLSSIHYQFVHNGTKGLLAVNAKLHLVNVSELATSTPQTFKTDYKWVSTGDNILFERSGRPGYINGKPLLLGRLVENVTEEGDLKEAINLDIDSDNWLTVLSPGLDGNCNSRTKVTFGQNIRSGCVVSVTQDELLNKCQLLQKKFQQLLLGPTLMDNNGMRIGSYGDSSVNNAADWIPILVPEQPRAASFSSSVLGKTKCAELILSMHLEIAFSLQGALANPQAKVIGIVLRYGNPQDVALTCFSASCQNQTIFVELVSSVSFVDVTNPPQPAYAEPPRLDLKLPHDFFYPFLPSSSMSVHWQGSPWLFFIFVSYIVFG